MIEHNNLLFTEMHFLKGIDFKKYLILKMAGSTRFELAVFAVTGRRVRPGYTTTPKLRELNSKLKSHPLQQIFMVGGRGVEPLTS